MNDEAVIEFLAHHGVKGMHWGVRRDPVKSGARADASWQRKNFTANTAYNHLTGDYTTTKVTRVMWKTTKAPLKANLKAINNKPEYKVAAKSGQLKDLSTPIAKQYHAEVEKSIAKIYKQAYDNLPSEMKTSPTGNFKATFNQGQNWFLVTPEVVTHAAPDNIVVPVRDTDGLIVDCEYQPPAEHMIELGVEFLTHHGVKGMHWGVERSRSALGRAAGHVIRRERATKARAAKVQDVATRLAAKELNKTEAGAKAVKIISEDAAKAHAATDKLKSHGKQALENTEIEHLIRRVDLETKLDALAKGPETRLERGTNATNKFLVDLAKQQAKSAASQFTAKKVATSLAKKAAVAAVV